jgi:hypothetical protein
LIWPGATIPEPIVSVADLLSDDRRDARMGLLGDPRVACAYDAAADHQALATGGLSPCRSRARRCLALRRRCFTYGRITVRRCARSRRCYANVRVVLRDFYVDDAGVPPAQAAQFLAKRHWHRRPYLALTIGGPPAIPAGIPTGDLRICFGSKCDAIRHYALLLLPHSRTGDCDCRVLVNVQHWPIPNCRH